MPDEVCPECKGKQWRVLGTTAQPCICWKRENLATFLGPEVSGATQIVESPLYALDRLMNEAVRDRTTENLFIKATWPALLPHLRLALGHRWYQNDQFRYSIVTDERILNVFVGNERYGSRPKQRREDTDAFNGLKDLVEGPDLVIVRLDFIGHKNIAAPGAFKQALMLREAAHKPSWVIQSPDGRYPISWNEEVAAYIGEYFDVVDLRKLPTPKSGPVPAPTIHVEEHESPPPKRKTAPRPEPEPEPDPDLMPTNSDDPYGINRTGKHKAGRKPPPWAKKRSGGEGGMPPI